MDIVGLKQKLSEAEKLKGEEKLGAMKRLYAMIHEAELAYSKDFRIPYGCLTEIRELMPAVSGSINRLESAKRRREERKVEQG